MKLKRAQAQVWIEWGKTEDGGSPWIMAVRSDVGSKPYVVAFPAWRLVFSLGAQVIVLTGWRGALSLRSEAVTGWCVSDGVERERHGHARWSKCLIDGRRRVRGGNRKGEEVVGPLRANGRKVRESKDRGAWLVGHGLGKRPAMMGAHWAAGRLSFC